MTKIYVYDVEVLNNYFSCAVEDYNSDDRWFFEISDFKNDQKELCKFFKEQEKYYLAGYNSNGFDNIILNKILYTPDITPDEIKSLANLIIESQRDVQLFELYEEGETKSLYEKYYNSPYYHSIDILTMLFSKMHRRSLKMLQVYINWHDVREMPIPHDHIVQEHERAMIEEYNWNDVASTKEVLKIKRDDANLRFNIETKFGIKCLSSDPVKTGVDLLLSKYTKATGESKKDIERNKRLPRALRLEDIVLPQIQFKSKTFQDFLEMVKEKTIVNTKGDFAFKLVHGGVVYSFGSGGIHSVDKPGVFKEDEDSYLIDCDVASLYPSILVNFEFYPEHLQEEFIKIYGAMKDERIAAKHAGDKLIASTYKLSLNGSYGNLMNQYSWLYDPFTAMQVTFNGQLFLAMLSERFTLAGMQVLSLNTDGITVRCKKDKLDEYYAICKEWEEETDFELEYVFYDRIIRRHVNSYVARNSQHEANGKDKGKIKEKGDLMTSAFFEDRLKGYGSSVVKLAVQEYFFNDVPVEDTIRNHKNLFDFCNMVNVGKQFKVEYKGEKVQQINRYYASNSPDAGELFKVDHRTISLMAGQRVKIVNKYDGVFPDDIDYRYYIKKAYLLISEIEVKQLELDLW